MATPSSSATSPSPPMTFMPHSTGSSQPSSSMFMDPFEKEQRQRAVQKFMARAEISTITRALRTRLSYASYKAVHNIPQVPLRDLEAQSQSQSASFSRTIAAKRKATANTSGNYYNSPAMQGAHGTNTGSNALRRGGSGSMLPPTSTSSPRTHYPAVNGNPYATASNNDPGSTSRMAGSNQSLYSSILAPPPMKQARTIHNAGDPPVPAPSRPLASPRARAQKPTSRSTAEANRPHAKSRKVDHPSSPNTTNTRKVKRASTAKGKQKQVPGAEMDVDVGGDVDMKAAATLTSLLLHHRPSITGSASSPRSSIDGSDAGSAYSHSHFAQSSARTIAGTTSPPASVAVIASTSTTNESSLRNPTPPPATIPDKATTPRPAAPADNEAASLMLFLATSPSPARPTNKDSRDLAAYRALGGGPPGILRDKGRVLFASGSGAETPAEAQKPSQLTRGGDSSFTSSISSIGGELGGSTAETKANPIHSQLLPPPSMPTHKSAPSSPSGNKDMNRSPRPTYPQPGSVEFNFNDFIHGSPSPSRGPVIPTPRANLGLRADVGRKLFEEEQMRHALSGAQSPGKHQDRALGAGIDLVQS